MTNTDSAAYHQGATRHIRRFLFGHATITLIVFLWLAIFTAVSARTYTVKSGDTLERIAKRELGSSTRWQEIAQLNQLPAPYKIRLGQQLNLPDLKTSGIPPIPSSPAKLSPPPAQLLPPGNALPPTPSEVFSAPVSHDISPSESFSSLWWIIPLSLLSGLIFYSVTLRISCWFSLVDTTFLCCLKLSLYSLLLALACFIGCALVWLIASAFGLATSSWSIEVAFSIVPFALIAGLLLSIILVKRTLDCKWRSVVTILVMASFAAQLLALVIAVSTLSLGTAAAMLMK